MKEDYNPLVTIGVLTYNSSKYVLETLESAKAQTYKNIELIISDDCSTDNTVELCREWVEKNKERFVRCEILTVEKNTGIPANCNRRLRASKGEWLKGIAGDDILASDCIESFINFVKENPEVSLAFSMLRSFGESKKDNSIHGNGALFHGNAETQYKRLLSRGCFTPVPSAFLKRKMLKALEGYDESFPLAESYILFLRATKAGYLMGFCDKELVFYRVHEASVSHSKRMDFLENLERLDAKYRLPEMKKDPTLWFWIWEMKVSLWRTKSVYLGRNLFANLVMLLSPVSIYGKIRRVLFVLKQRRNTR